jgi:hypothetical protein
MHPFGEKANLLSPITVCFGTTPLNSTHFHLLTTSFLIKEPSGSEGLLLAAPVDDVRKYIGVPSVWYGKRSRLCDDGVSKQWRKGDRSDQPRKDIGWLLKIRDYPHMLGL